MAKTFGTPKDSECPESHWQIWLTAQHCPGLAVAPAWDTWHRALCLLPPPSSTCNPCSQTHCGHVKKHLVASSLPYSSRCQDLLAHWPLFARGLEEKLQTSTLCEQNKQLGSRVIKPRCVLLANKMHPLLVMKEPKCKEA